MTVAIIGAGFVGAACAKAMLLRGSCDTILLNDIDTKKARGLRNDLSHGSLLCPPATIDVSDIADFSGARVVVITAGVNERTGGAIDRSDPRGRLLLLPRNTAIYAEIVPKIAKAAPHALILVVTDPPDALADVVRAFAPDQAVLSSGTFLDSLRFRFQIAKQFNRPPANVRADVLGEHGTSQVYVWSGVHIDGQPLREVAEAARKDLGTLRMEVEQAVKFANIEIIEGIGASQHGIGIVVARIVEAVVRGKTLEAPIGTYRPEYGVTLSLPTTLGPHGSIKVHEPQLASEEQDKLAKSARILGEAVAGVRASLPPGGSVS